ncbi:hypothetical protein HUJ05_006264 [Dendroctonus ponderosae]|nr:hypothetical protein HUJ05_006264 [Dendroctonus ponderosae]
MCRKTRMELLQAEAPRLDISNRDNGYHGIVKENESMVEVTPPIRVTGSEVCQFRIVSKHHVDAPFSMYLNKDGQAVMEAHRRLNCEKRKNYKFDIIAVGCNKKESQR